MTTKVEKKVKVARRKTENRYMYLGPTFTNHALYNKSVWIGTNRPLHLKDEFESYPMLIDLFVLVDDLPNAFKDLKNPDSLLSIAYQNVKEKMKGSVK